MVDADFQPSAARTILVTRLDALGDIVLGTMLLDGLHAKWPAARIQLVVRPGLGGVASILPDWVDVTPLPFDPRLPFHGREQQIASELRDFAKVHQADLVIIAEYNRIWAGELLAELCGADRVVTFNGVSGLNFRHAGVRAELPPASSASPTSPASPGSPDRWQIVAVDGASREPIKYRAMLKAMEIDPAPFEPNIMPRDEDRKTAAQLWADTALDPEQAIVCFPSSGELLVRSLDAACWVRWIGRLRLTRPVVLFGADADSAVLDAIEACGLPDGVCRVVAPSDRVGITAAFLERAGAYIGMDTGPMHLAAVLNRPTLGVFGGGHHAERFLPAGRRAAAIRMSLGCFGCDWLCPFDRRLCIKDIPEWPLSEAGDHFLNNIPDNPTPFTPRVYDIAPPDDLPAVLLGPTMRQHRRFLQLNHELIEHHAYLARLHAEQARQVNELLAITSDLARQNHERREVIDHLTRQNHDKGQSIDLLAAQNHEKSQSIDELAAQNFKQRE